MTHFTVLVLVPENTPLHEIEKRVEELLSPYDESKEVEPYLNSYGEESTRNPQARWDWWRIGGRWNGAVTANRRSEPMGFNFSEEFERLEENMIPVRRIDHKVYGTALVTPDGQWHEKGKVGWFATIHNPKSEEEWEEEIIKIIQQHRDCVLVGIDCHI